MTVKHWNTGASAVRFREQADKQSKKAKAKLVHVMTLIALKAKHHAIEDLYIKNADANLPYLF